MLWFAVGPSIYGWYIGLRDGLREASYFTLLDYYAVKPAALYRSVEDELHWPWVQIAEQGEGGLPHPHPPPMPQVLCHELVRLQDEFIRHWLFFDDDPDSETQACALHERQLSVRHVNIKPSRLGKLRIARAVWRYDAPGADLNVLVHLSQRWPLDEQLPA